MNRKRVSRLMDVDGNRGRLSEAEAEPAGRRPQDLSVPAEGVRVDRAQPGVEHGYHVYKDGAGFRLSGGGDGLVQPVRSELEVVADAGTRLLRRGAEVRPAGGRKPEIFNSDQGSQFTSEKFTGELAAREIAISMDGRGRCMDNIFIERLWRSLKYEEVYLKDYESVTEARAGIEKYLRFYNQERLHQSLAYRTPAAIYLARG